MLSPYSKIYFALDFCVNLLKMISHNVPFIILVCTIIGLIIGKYKYGISFFQSLEKIAHEQQEYRRKHQQESFRNKIVQRHILLGNEFLSVGNLNAAKIEFNSALKVDPLNSEAAMGLHKSQIFDEIDNYGFTSEVLRKRIDTIFNSDQNDAHGFYFLGLLYKDSDYEKAINYFETALKIEPNFPDAYYRIGMVYETYDNLDSTLAISYYERALSLSELNPIYLNNLAYQYFQQGFFDKAIEKYNVLIKLDKNDLLPYITMSHSLVMSQDFHKAGEYINSFIGAFEKTPSILETPLNKMTWYFKCYNDSKIVLDTKQVKVFYAYLLGYYKNYLDNNIVIALKNLDSAKKLFDNSIELIIVLRLVNFEIEEYLLNGLNLNRQANELFLKIHEVFSDDNTVSIVN